MLTAMLKIQIFISFFGQKNDVETMSKFRCQRLFNVKMMSAFDVEMMLKRCLIDILTMSGLRCPFNVNPMCKTDVQTISGHDIVSMSIQCHFATWVYIIYQIYINNTCI